ncbi:hypothetical protein DWF00_19755, partial [Bosea caraganae]
MSRSHLIRSAARPPVLSGPARRIGLRYALLSSLAGLALVSPAALAQTSFPLDLSGVPGNPGSGNDGGLNKNGNPGDPGHPGQSTTLSVDGPSVPGSLAITSNGGSGGQGVDGAASGTYSNGGDGGAGGAGGTVGLTVTGALAGSLPAGGVLVDLRADGGIGGAPGSNNSYAGRSGTPGAGGAAGSLDFTQQAGSAITSASGGPAVQLHLQGGNGLDAGDASTIWDTAQGVTGGSGGAGGTGAVALSGAITSTGSGVVVLSQGGDA